MEDREHVLAVLRGAWASDHDDIWSGVTLVARVYLPVHERAAAACAFLRALPPDEREMTALAAFPGAGTPIPPLFSYMSEAELWAQWAAPGELDAYALLATARSGRVLNKMSAQERAEAGLTNCPLSYFSVTRDKANLAPAGAREWRRVVSVPLGNGDTVGVVEAWEWPDAFEGMTAGDLVAVQRAVKARCDEGNPPRFSVQAGDDWVGVLVAEVLDLDLEVDRKRITKMINAWLKSKAFKKGSTKDSTRRQRPTVEVGEWGTV